MEELNFFGARGSQVLTMGLWVMDVMMAVAVSVSVTMTAVTVAIGNCGSLHGQRSHGGMHSRSRCQYCRRCTCKPNLTR